MSKCCKSILGCERCVNGWFEGPEALLKTCPACNTECGYSETLMLKGPVWSEKCNPDRRWEGWTSAPTSELIISLLHSITWLDCSFNFMVDHAWYAIWNHFIWLYILAKRFSHTSNTCTGSSFSLCTVHILLGIDTIITKRVMRKTVRTTARHYSFLNSFKDNASCP